jgi:uncharacterized protein (TIRG00374 family)
LKQRLSKLIQYILFPALGIAIIWWLFKDQEASSILEVVRNDVNYYWIGLSIVLGILSHISRAARWQQLIAATGEKTGLNNTYWSVMIGYFVNLMVPRMGEVSKCGVLSKYEKIPFTKVIGTVVAERLFDLIMLILISMAVFALQFDLLGDFLTRELDFGRVQSLLLSPIPWLFLIVTMVAIVLIYRNRSSFRVFKQFEGLWLKFKDGFTSIRRVENKTQFLAHTVFIWLMYFAMVYVCFFSLQATSHLTVETGLTILLTGSLGMLAPVQGGLGTWHAMVIATLALYNVDREMAGIFALVVHAAQNIMIIATGILGFIILPYVNRASNEGLNDSNAENMD